MNYCKLGLFVFLGLTVVCGFLIFLRDHVIECADTTAAITDLSSLSAATEEISAAEDRLMGDVKPAEIITRLYGDVQHIAIVFDGLPERPLTARMLDVLKKHDAPAVFFVEGQNAANQPETIALIQEEEQEIGNYTFVGISSAEKLPKKRLLAELCRTQMAVSALSPQTPSLFRAAHTAYTDDLLRALRAAGIDYAVKENVRHSAGSFRDAEAAAAFAVNVPAGSIIAIKFSRPVDPHATAPIQTEERPAVDKKPTLKDPSPVKHAPPHADAADEPDWMLTAFEAAGMRVISVHEFRKIRYIPEELPTGEGGKGGL